MSAEKLSIAYVFDGNFTAGEGVPSYIRTLGDYYSSIGHDVSYIVGDSAYNEPNIHSLGRTKTVRFNGNRVDIPFPTPNRQVEEVLQAINPDILHVQMPYSPFLGARFVNHAKPETRLIGTFHIVPESILARAGSHLLSFINQQSQRKFDKVVSVSPSAQEFAESTFHLNTEVLPCPVNLDHFRRARKLHEYDDGKVNLVFMGRLVERKGCRYLLSAVETLDKTLRSKLRVLIAGKGPLLNKLQSQVEAAGLEDIVSFLGFVSDEDKPDLLASADIAVFPSTGGESFGIMLLEAMASDAGVVIGGDNVGYRGVLNNRAETLFDPRNVGGFSNVLKELILSREKREFLHDYQKELVKRYDIGVIGPSLLDIYKSPTA